ncbi:MAG TPA: hypothetical protein DDY98_08870, partial [Ruminococcaceae bacterium]|nr:hypothetical protein [Oscillospiraceae bacterium]
MKAPKLKFREDGKFRILMISDMHAGEDCNPKLIRGIEALVAESKPDFVMLGGDQILLKQNKEDIRPYFCKILEPILKRKLPWAAVFGNHDREAGIDIAEEMEIYESMDGFLGEKGPKELSGVGNYVIPILSSDGEKTAYRIWAMDSHRGHEDTNKAFHLSEDTCVSLPRTNNLIINQSMPYPDQVAWYYNQSCQWEQQEGQKTPGIMFFHIMLPEFIYVSQNPEQTNAVGLQRESLDATLFNSGLFSFALQRGDIKGFFAGHDHLNTLQGEYCGITMACDGSVGYNMSTHDDMRG